MISVPRLVFSHQIHTYYWIISNHLFKLYHKNALPFSSYSRRFELVEVTSRMSYNRFCFSRPYYTLSCCVYILLKSTRGMESLLHCSETLSDEIVETSPSVLFSFRQPHSNELSSFGQDVCSLEPAYFVMPSYALSVQKCENFYRYREHAYSWMRGVFLLNLSLPLGM